MSKYVGKIVTNQAPAGYSVFFDGTGDYLNLTQSAFAVGTSNFTLEAWVYLTAAPGTEAGVISSFNTGGGQGFYLAVNSSRQPFFAVGNGAVSNPTVTGTAISLNTWVHLAGVRSSGTLTLYVNGTSVGTPTSATASIDRTLLGIGLAYPNSPQGYITGYISNARVTSSALYTAAFTPPTQLLNVTNTSLLTCNSPAIVDQSSNAFAITTNGNSAVSTFTPFAAYNPYNPALGASTPGVWTLDEAMQAAATRQWNMYDPYFQNTTLLLHGNGTNAAQNNTFLDSSSNNFTITRNGNTTQGSFSPFSQTGWSNYFDGTSGQYLNTVANAAFNFGTGDFTVEAWVYPTSTTGTRPIIEIRTTGGANGFALLSQSGALTLNVYTNNVFVGASSNSMTLNAWNHVALTRSGNTWTYWINGVSGGSFTNSSTQSDGGTTGPKIGGSTTAGEIWIGYISNARITKGGALYTGTFTPSTTPLTTTVSSGTVSLLTCQSNRFVDNSTANAGSGFTITVNGSPSVQAFSPFYPTAAYTPATIGGSGYFDGNDSLNIASNAAWNLDGNFTVECWAYLTSFSDNRLLAVVVTNGFALYVNGSGFPLIDRYGVGALITSSTAISLNSWNHISAVRSGSSMTLYLNGSSVGTATSSHNFVQGALYIATDNAGRFHNGWISGIKWVKGTATAPSGIPTSPPTNTTNTQLLLNFTNAGIVDSTAKNVLETVGNAQISTTQSKFGGSSMYFDGTGDYLLLPSSPNFAFSGDFTVEAWVYLTANIANGVGGYLTDFRVSSTNNYAFGFLGDAGVTKMYSFIGAVPASTTGTATVTLNTWNHVAYVRSGGVITMYLNGAANGTLSNSFSQGATSVTICSRFNGATEYITGYIDDLRITRFARYTANFTPQTSQWQDQ